MSRPTAPHRLAGLRSVHKIYIVQRLAAFDAPHEVADGLHRSFGIRMSESGIRHYDPTTFRGRRLAMRWRELFEATRKRVLARRAALGAEVAALRHQETVGRGGLAEGLKALDARVQRRARRVGAHPRDAAAEPRRRMTAEEFIAHIRRLIGQLSRNGMEQLLIEFGVLAKPKDGVPPIPKLVLQDPRQDIDDIK